MYSIFVTAQSGKSKFVPSKFIYNSYFTVSWHVEMTQSLGCNLQITVQIKAKISVTISEMVGGQHFSTLQRGGQMFSNILSDALLHEWNDHFHHDPLEQ